MQTTETGYEFRVGRVLSLSLDAWLNNFVPFTVLAMLCFSPLIVWDFSVATGELTAESLDRWRQIHGFAGSLPQWLLAGAVTFGTIKQLRGERVGFGECVRVGLARMFPVFFVALVVGLVIGVATLLLVVPGIIVTSMLYVAVPASVIERTGPGAAMSRSAELTRGYRWRTFGVWLLVTAITLGVVLVMTLSMAGSSATLESLEWYILLQSPVVALLSTLGAVVAAVSYHELRTAKEGSDIDQLASVFD